MNKLQRCNDVGKYVAVAPLYDRSVVAPVYDSRVCVCVCVYRQPILARVCVYR